MSWWHLINKHKIVYESYIRGRLMTTWARDLSAGLKALSSQLLQTINPFIARPLIGSPNCAYY